jgi:hypothetical protein
MPRAEHINPLNRKAPKLGMAQSGRQCGEGLHRARICLGHLVGNVDP